MPAPQGRKRLSTRQRQEHILDAALALYAADGYTSVGMRDVAAACGMTATAIYRHFDNKEALLVGVFDRLSDEMTSGMRSASRIADLQDRLDFLVRTHIRLALADPPILRLYRQEERSLPAAELERFRTVERAYIAQWTDILRTLHPETTASEARTTVIAAFGAINSIAGTRSSRSTRSITTQLAAIAHRILETGPTA
jgi:AcrR family transcriptional regulator